MFIAGLVAANENRPAYWQSYVLGTLVRAVSFGRPDIIANWCAAVNGTQIYYSPPDDNLLSGVGIVRDETTAIVAFQGTSNTLQLIQQILQSPQGIFAGISGSVNGYYGSCFFERKAAMQNVIDALPATFNFFFAGHSAGGAIAHVSFKWFDEYRDFNAIGCVTFGQPRTGNPTFANGTRVPYVRWITQDDFIPGLPPNTMQAYALLGPVATHVLGLNYRHARDGWLLLSDGRTVGGSASIVDTWGPPNANPFLRLRNAWPACYNAHQMLRYNDALLARSTAQGSPVSLAPFIAMNGQMG